MDIPMIQSGKVGVRRISDPDPSLPQTIDFGAVLMASMEEALLRPMPAGPSDSDRSREALEPENIQAEIGESAEVNLSEGVALLAPPETHSLRKEVSEFVPRESATGVVTASDAANLTHLAVSEGRSDLPKLETESESDYWRAAPTEPVPTAAKPTGAMALQNSSGVADTQSNLRLVRVTSAIDRARSERSRSAMPVAPLVEGVRLPSAAGGVPGLPGEKVAVVTHSFAVSTQSDGTQVPELPAPVLGKSRSEEPPAKTLVSLSRVDQMGKPPLHINPVSEAGQMSEHYPRMKATALSNAAVPLSGRVEQMTATEAATNRPVKEALFAAQPRPASQLDGTQHQRLIQEQVTFSERAHATLSQGDSFCARPDSSKPNTPAGRPESPPLLTSASAPRRSVEEGAWPPFAAPDVGHTLGREQAMSPVGLDQTQRAELPRAVAQQLAEVLPRANRTGVEITLSPEELGRVRLTVSTTDSGATLMVVADRPETMDLIRRHLDILVQTFRDQGYSGLNVSLGNHGNSTFNQRGFVETGPTRADGSGTETLESTQASARPLSILPADGLDIRL